MPADAQLPLWLARNMAGWVWQGARVLIPCAGGSELVLALVERGHVHETIHAIEHDVQFAHALTAQFPRVHVTCTNFLTLPATDRFDQVALCSPVEPDLQTPYVLEALAWAREVIVFAPLTIESSLARDDELWRTGAAVVRRARVPSHDAVCLKLKRRTEPRRGDEVVQVSEEVWLEPKQEA